MARIEILSLEEVKARKNTVRREDEERVARQCKNITTFSNMLSEFVEQLKKEDIKAELYGNDFMGIGDYDIRVGKGNTSIISIHAFSLAKESGLYKVNIKLHKQYAMEVITPIVNKYANKYNFLEEIFIEKMFEE